ncbi:MAG: glycosyltransferase family 2 protein, partial [Clostridiales bacterium]|nr:glycosyltransferase family 2 protein [Clostridiales bacterium]
NEEKTIRKVIADVQSELSDAVIYVYDNNSTDKTYELAADMADMGVIVRKEPKQGKGRVVRAAFREINAHCYLVVDGDDTYALNRSREMCDLVLKNRLDMVIGDRLSTLYFTENKRRFHNSGNLVVRLFINLLFNSDIRDVMTGLRAMSYRFVKSFPIISKGFEIETEMTIHAVDKDFYIENINVDYRDRPAGNVSKLNTFADGYKVIKTIIKLYKNYRPLRFFSMVSLLLFVISGIFLTPVLLAYLETGMVPQFPTLIVCGFTAIAGIQSFFGGLILDTVAQKNRQDFELKLTEIDSWNQFGDRKLTSGIKEFTHEQKHY